MLNVENDNIKPENGKITPSEVDLKRANIIADTFVEKVETAAPVRIATSVDEKKGAVKSVSFTKRFWGFLQGRNPLPSRRLRDDSAYPFTG